MESTSPEPEPFDAVVVGAGFAGLHLLHRLRESGLRVQVLEAGDGIGGTWYFNRYPGARCDVESADYSYSWSSELEQEWRWSERYAQQPEILAYVNHVVDRFGLAEHVRLNARVAQAEFDEDAARWTVSTDDGYRVVAPLLFLATGCLSVPRIPSLPGQERFQGTVLHTATWPHEPVDFTGKRVGVIGTGSSGTQAIPVIANVAAHLHVFQRTPNFSVPANNRPISDAEDRQIKSSYRDRREKTRTTATGLNRDMNRLKAADCSPNERNAIFEKYWDDAGFGFILAFSDLLLDPKANAAAVEFFRGKIEALVDDPETARKLVPTTYPFGAKRPCVDTGYYQTFNRENVTLVDVLTDPISEVTECGIRTASGEVELDAIVYATGFDAMTGAVMRMDIVGRDGLRLADAWAAGPLTYLGLQTAGFPNLFFIAGPGSPSVLTNVMVSIEQHVAWLDELVRHMRECGWDTVEATQDAQDSWVAHVNEVASRTLYPTADSWYLGANVPGKPRVFMPYAGGLRAYRKTCDQVASAGYSGFALKRRELAQRV